MQKLVQKLEIEKSYKIFLKKQIFGVKKDINGAAIKFKT